jgi:succinate dehydrogenase/fumarate reductase flavoprotein subunit
LRYFDTIIIGTGCAGYNAADWLYDLGHRNIVLITEGVSKGTSRNTGSDKQTYYKLSLSSDADNAHSADSVSDMAKSYFDGGGMHGDHALIEAACSVKCFMKLVMLGIPFPTNKYGEYVGYKTDHDPRQRATSCGPLTSKLMTEALERSVSSKGIEVIDNMQVIKIHTDADTITGVTAIDLDSFDYHSFTCENIILATGGPAGVYKHSVYPLSQSGATGLALDAGAVAQNLCEWQYGLASTKFRWNVSGTYQQVLPCYVSVSPDGTSREFLIDELGDEANDMVFLKGYQWPFDSRKVDGSSRIDMLVHREISAGNRVYMDFRKNPRILDFCKLMPEAYDYLNKSDALFGTPIKRLEKMNPKAIELYRNNGIDLYTEMLEIAVCSQHCNGGIAVDANWESSVRGLYVVGEAAGIFGVYRPGGSALNDTQVGSMRAAEHIAFKQKDGHIGHRETSVMGSRLGDRNECECESKSDSERNEISYIDALEKAQYDMSMYAAFQRDVSELNRILNELLVTYDSIKVPPRDELPDYFKAKDLILTQINMLSAMIYSAESFGSRGAALVCGLSGTDDLSKIVLTHAGKSFIEHVRPIPESGGWFEKIWHEYTNSNRL